MDSNEIKSICPMLQKFVLEVASLKPSINGNKIGMKNLRSGLSSAVLRGNMTMNDRFTLVIPYCDTLLEWDVIFMSSRPDLPPDFHFDDRNFMMNISLDHILDKVPSLTNWNSDDPKALSNVIMEFLTLYKYYQIELISNDHRASMEISVLLENGYDKDLEVISQRDSILLSVCISSQLDYFTDDFKIVLLINFSLHHDTVRPQILFFGENPFWSRDDKAALPVFSTTDYLLDYTKDLISVIEKLQNEKVRKLARRKQLLLEFKLHLNNCLVEMDTIYFLYALFELSLDNFYFLYRVDLTKNFPQEDPQHRLISVYCHHINPPHSKIDFFLHKVNYHPKMNPQQVVEAALNRLHELVGSFRRRSVEFLEKNLTDLSM